MDFINKGFSSILSIALITGVFIAVVFLFFNLLPFIIIAGLAIWLAIKGINMLKKWTSGYNTRDTSRIYKSAEAVKNNEEFDLSKNNVIDVDYKEVK